MWLPHQKSKLSSFKKLSNSSNNAITDKIVFFMLHIFWNHLFLRKLYIKVERSGLKNVNFFLCITLGALLCSHPRNCKPSSIHKIINIKSSETPYQNLFFQFMCIIIISSLKLNLIWKIWITLDAELILCLFYNITEKKYTIST